MKRLTHISHIAQDSNYKVMVDDRIISEHTTMHKAQQSATNAVIENPEAKVRYVQELNVIARAIFEDVPEKTETQTFTTK